MIEPSSSCPSCGVAVRAGISFCEACGYPLAGNRAVGTPGPPPYPDGPSDVAGVLRYRGSSEPAMRALSAFRLQTQLAGAVAIGLAIIAWLFLPKSFFATWLISGIFVSWRCFVRIPSAIRNVRYHQARRMALTTALINLIFAGVVTTVFLLIAYVRSGDIEDAPPLHLQRGLR